MTKMATWHKKNLFSNPFLYNRHRKTVPAFQNKLTFNHFLINYGWIRFLKLDNAVSLLPKPAISLHKIFLPWKCQTTVTNNLSHPGVEIETGFFSMYLGYYQIYINSLEYLQHCQPKSGWKVGQAHMKTIQRL